MRVKLYNNKHVLYRVYNFKCYILIYENNYKI